MRRSILVTALLLLALVVPLSAQAITNGAPDDEHDYVGAFVANATDPLTGESFDMLLCTGTVVAPQVVLAAAHCFVGLEAFGITGFRFTLDEDLDKDDNGVIDPDLALLEGSAVPHEQFASGGLSNPLDIGVFLLDTAVSVTPAALPPADYLSRPEVRDDTTVAVGYGLRREGHDQARQAFRLSYRRLQAEQHLSSLTKAWVTFSMNEARGDGGGCFGDSGGPHLHGDVVVSVTSMGDPACKAIDKTYRVDTPWAREFLARFVALP